MIGIQLKRFFERLNGPGLLVFVIEEYSQPVIYLIERWIFLSRPAGGKGLQACFRFFKFYAELRTGCGSNEQSLPGIPV